MCNRGRKDMTAVWAAVLIVLFAGASDADSRGLEAFGPAGGASMRAAAPGAEALIDAAGRAIAGAAGGGAELAWAVGAGMLGVELRAKGAGHEQ